MATNKKNTFAQHIKTNHYMTLEGLSRKIEVSYSVLKGIAVGTHKSQPVIDKLINGGYIKSLDDLPNFRGYSSKKIKAIGDKNGQ